MFLEGLVLSAPECRGHQFKIFKGKWAFVHFSLYLKLFSLLFWHSCKYLLGQSQHPVPSSCPSCRIISVFITPCVLNIDLNWSKGCRLYFVWQGYSGSACTVHSFSFCFISHLCYLSLSLPFSPSRSFLQRKEGYALMSQCGAVLCLIR